MKNFSLRVWGPLLLLFTLFLFLEACRTDAKIHSWGFHDDSAVAKTLQSSPVQGMIAMSLGGQAERVKLATWQTMTSAGFGKEAEPEFRLDSTSTVWAEQKVVSFQLSDGSWVSYHNCWVLPGTERDAFLEFVGLFIPERFPGKGGEWILLDRRLVPTSLYAHTKPKLVQQVPQGSTLDYPGEGGQP